MGAASAVSENTSKKVDRQVRVEIEGYSFDPSFS